MASKDELEGINLTRRSLRLREILRILNSADALGVTDTEIDIVYNVLRK